MAILAWVLGILGGLGAVVGIIAAAELVPLLTELPAAFTPIFWLTLGAVLLLACIATVLANRQYE
ncbi:MAG: hypothetical protein Q8O55_00995 [Dehalococcoidales bacterium]|nr:hypothetical protein [Dehalococcoidales bacterium]